jgi:hypothetical protein
MNPAILVNKPPTNDQRAALWALAEGAGGWWNGNRRFVSRPRQQFSLPKPWANVEFSGSGERISRNRDDATASPEAHPEND